MQSDTLVIRTQLTAFAKKLHKSMLSSSRLLTSSKIEEIRGSSSLQLLKLVILANQVIAVVANLQGNRRVQQTTPADIANEIYMPQHEKVLRALGATRPGLMQSDLAIAVPGASGIYLYHEHALCHSMT